jgi:branched-chain amino acid transport system permease protein
MVEMLVLRRIYRAPELFQLLATFALVLIIKDAALWLWGPEDLFGPRAPGLAGAVHLLGRRLPQYDLLLIVIGPLVLGCCGCCSTAPAGARSSARPPRTARCWARWA